MKELMRQQILNKRNQLSAEQVMSKSTLIINRLMEQPELQQSINIMVYLDFRNEVKTDDLIRRLLEQEKQVFIPVTNPATHTLMISQLEDPAKDLERGHFGLLEPKSETLRPVDPTLIDLVIVPGLVFDHEGYRIGFGAGYYDRFLPTLRSGVPLISLLYELQLVDRVPREPHDVPVHLLITEHRTIDCKST
ncbi:5-formyltetrahydrofolate cyclo-ligase [Anoxynatronum buryatiense]|uniref:5-formyltetrahydrofolate cyclo-ligase n=1 Tax=Anoxynatronum buryatiense TaxID=489973 RepID=A0AA45WU53_9CLOT|nr:5-formyltetrahydrofolate cyclo-ligase [Anoxynatronum buryatiense]SMP45306.1 5-formyltetrahydrofolate cyclo-ligase [Anoxynatronum buryatiense]